MQEQVDDQGLAGLARPRTTVPRPVASADPTVLGPAPAALDCPYLHLDDDGPGCVALAPAIRLSRRQVEIVCATAAHVACPRLVKADAGRLPVAVDPPAPLPGRRERPATQVPVAQDAGVVAAAVTAAPSAEAPVSAVAATIEQPMTHDARVPGGPVQRTSQGTAPATEPSAAGTAAVIQARLGAGLARGRIGARKHIVLRPATAAAWVVLVGTLIVVIALLTARGGLTLPATATPSSPAVAGASPSAPTPSAVPSPTAPQSAAPSASASIPPSSPSPSVAATPSPSASSAGSPFTPEQLAVLKPCPGGTPDCYQYRIVSGDNLRNLATFFGLTYPALLAANPDITNPSIVHVGQRITIPFPVAPKTTPTPKP